MRCSVNPDTDELWMSLVDVEVDEARRLALARLNEVQRHQSAHRPTSRNSAAQYRGAAGEIAARKWLTFENLKVESGFEEDRPWDSDLTVAGLRIEVMTAQIAHRTVTGFCVPPGKLAAARRRMAIGYLFVGTGSEQEPRDFLIQGFASIDEIDREPARPTRVSERSPSVLNHVVPSRLLRGPVYVVQLLSSAGQL
jgi:hypothetical protein